MDTRTAYVFATACACSIGTLVLAFGLSPAGSGRRGGPDTGVDGRPDGAGLRPRSLFALASRAGMPTALTAGVAILACLDLLVAFLPVLGEARGFSPAFIGAMLSLRALAGLGSRLAMPLMLDHFTRRHVLLGTLATAGVAMAALAVADRPGQLVAVMVLLGLTLGVGQPMTTSWVAGQAPDAVRATALALRISVNRFGQMVLPACFGAVAAVAGLPAVIMISAAGLFGTSALVGRASFQDVEDHGGP